MDDIPFEDFEPEDSSLNIEGILYKEAAGGWSPTEDIDWDTPLELDEDRKEALGDAATQFYYSNISHLMLCGRLLERGRDVPLQKLALFLAFSKMRNVEAFGRYLARTPPTEEVAPSTKEYLNRLTEDQDITTLLLGMGVLGGTVGYGVLDHLKEGGDPVFRQIAENVIEQKHENEDLIVNYLGNIVDSAEEEDIEDIKRQAEFYRDRSAKIVMFHSDLLETLGIDPEEVRDTVLEATDSFYSKVGLEL